MHYQPKQDLLQNRIILVTGASDGIGRVSRAYVCALRRQR
ncbi:putative oxoacyl-(acyl carrier protein) reductase [Salmonella enterica subsp. enterica serovar Heidelberg str. 670102-5]|nr:putative oxoacyl-(acyl carrier protein) reductase [Salmonella enterica subsp. enterica serovar Heidelberg str. 670102-5]